MRWISHFYFLLKFCLVRNYIVNDMYCLTPKKDIVLKYVREYLYILSIISFNFLNQKFFQKIFT